MKNSHNYSGTFEEVQTQAASPQKKSNNQKNIKFQQLQSQFTTEPGTTIHSKKLSKTENEIYSHDLISQIMKKRHNYSVNHKVGIFDSEIQLYSKPRNPEDYELLQLSDQRQIYQSEYSKKIVDINKKLNHGKSLSQRLKNKKQQQIIPTFCRTKRPASANIRQKDNDHKKISVSGLVSYNFNSVNARKTLGFDFDRDEDKLSSILSKLNQNSKCCASRQHSLIQKTKKHKAGYNKQIKQAIFSDFQTKTQNFITNLHEQLDEQKMIFGVKWNKLLCIKELMQQQKIPYVEAESIVNQIEQKKVKQKKIQKQKKTKHNQQDLLLSRRQVVQRNRVMVKHLYFVD